LLQSSPQYRSLIGLFPLLSLIDLFPFTKLGFCFGSLAARLYRLAPIYGIPDILYLFLANWFMSYISESFHKSGG
jgi:hypothetical protein